MANPLLNDKAFGEAATRDGATWQPPIDDGPISPWQSAADRVERMTVAGTAQATALLLVLLLVAAAFGWAAVDSPAPGQAVSFPAIAFLGVIVGFAAVIASMFKPSLARVLAPVYALAEGYFVGAVSKAYESYQHGIVLQAVGVTLGVFTVMLLLHVTRILRVTDRMRRMVIGATFGVMAFYLVAIVLRLLGGGVSFLDSPSAFGILFSVAVAAIAAFNLSLDFDFIERGARSELPKRMEWFAALGLLVTIVWLYLEILRLLSKLRSR
jgi:uncharacterized YccA/Bax inhibitor family protein